MNNFHGNHSRNPYGNRGVQQNIDPYSREIALRSNQPHQFLSNRLPNNPSQTPFLPQRLPNENYQANFINNPNPDIFHPASSSNESNYGNHLITNRLQGHDSVPNVTIPYKINESNVINKFPDHNIMPPQRKKDSFSDCVTKPLYGNMKIPQDRFSCLQNEQAPPKLGSSPPIFQGKGFPFNNDKFMTSNNESFINKIPNPAESSFLRPHRGPSLFPAYANKDAVSLCDSSSTVKEPMYSSNNSFCDKTLLPSSCSKLSMSPEEKLSHEKALEKAIDELLQNPSSLKAVRDSLCLDEAVTCSNNNYPFLSDSQQACFQTSNINSFLKNQMGLTEPTTSNIVSSKSCFMQNTPFSIETEVSQSLKESVSSSSSFNFESSITSADIYDLLPGIDAFLRESANKSKEPSSTAGNIKPSSAFSTSETFIKPSIPFIGDTHSFLRSLCNEKDTFHNKAASIKESFPDNQEMKSQETFDLKSSKIPQENKSSENQVKDEVSEDSPKIHSFLEEAIDMLVTNDAIVGLEYIIEYKRNLNQKGSFPFKCNLCNSAITRSSIMDHIIGFKHRMRYVKIKDQALYDQINFLKVEKAEKESKVLELCFHLEKIHGRGHVIVDVEEGSKDTTKPQSSPTQEKEKEDQIVEDVFTLDKIPIGFEALSPGHDDDGNSTSFILDSSISQDNSSNSAQQKNEVITISTEEKKAAITSISEEKKEKEEISSKNNVFMPGLDTELSIKPIEASSSSLFSQAELIKELSTSEVKKEPEVRNASPSPIQIKRCASPDSEPVNKHQKITDATDSLQLIADTLADQVAKVKREQCPDTPKILDPSLLQDLSTCIISTEEEASFALQAVNILMQMFLRYKLQHVSFDVVENLMKSLQSRSPDKIGELLTLLNLNKVHQDEESEESKLFKMEDVQQDKSQSEVKQETSNQGPENMIETSSNSVVTNGSIAVHVSAPSTSAAVSDNTVSQTVTTGSGISPTTTTTTPVSLQPPPFFNWPQTSNSGANSASFTAPAPATQNMIWATPYQQSQPQFSQMPYYQAQNFNSVFVGNQAYQNQFPVMQQSSVLITAPPPPPPPLPPTPSNPPLPPLPTSATNLMPLLQAPVPPPPPPLP